MVSLTSVLVPNAIGAFLMIIVLISTVKNKRPDSIDEKLFCILAFGTLCLCVLESMSYIVDGRIYPGCFAVTRIINSMIFILQAPLLLMWVCYVDYKAYHSERRIKRQLPVLAIPAVLIMLLGVGNLFFDIYFTVTPDNRYLRSDWIFFPPVAEMIYYIHAGIISLLNRRVLRKRVSFPIALFMLIPATGVVIQFSVYGLSVLWASVAMGLVAVYINAQNERSSIDVLTGLYNRMHLDRYLRHEIRRRREETRIAGIMLDADGFKAINDTYGHGEGDCALASVGKILLAAVGAKNFAARYAGDEFIIIMRILSETEIKDVIDKINIELIKFNKSSAKPYTLRFSIGYSIFGADGEDTIDAFLTRMDKSMYDDKQKRRELII